MAIQVFGERRKDRNTQESLPLSPVTNLTSVVSGTSVTVSWNDPSGNGGDAVVGFFVGRDGSDVNGAGPWSTTVTSLTHSFKFTNLTQGSTYTFTVYPITSVQNGPSSTTTSTIPDVTPPPTTTRGAVPIGQANYAIPTGQVLYIDANATTGDSTGDGTASKPFKTLDKARNTATSSGLWYIVCRAGVYHESITNTSTTKQYAIQAYPNEAVWFDGSTIRTDWTNNGNGTWSCPLTTVFKQTAHDATGATPAMKAEGGASSPAGQNEQVFRDGNLLQAIARDATPVAGQFSIHNYGNSATQTVVIADNPSGHEMRVSDLTTLWTSNNTTSWYGVGVRRYASDDIEKPNGAAMFYGGTSGNSTFENCWFRQNGITALALSKPNITVRNCTFEYNGQAAFGGSQCDNLLAQRCIVQFNNTRHWQAGPSTAGIKVTRCDGATVDDCFIFNNNEANGIWYDWSAIRNTIINCEVGSTSSLTQSGSSKGATGIQFEESDGGLLNGTQYWSYIANNTIYGFRWNLRLIVSGYFKVWYNTFDSHSEADIVITTDRGPNPGNDGRSSAIVPWLTRNIEVCNNDFKDGGSIYAQILNYDSFGTGGTYLSGGAQVSIIAGNRLAPVTSGHLFLWGNGSDSSRTNYETFAALLSRSDMTGKNWVNYQQSTMPADGTAGQTMPSDIAGLLGKTAGTRHIGIF